MISPDVARANFVVPALSRIGLYSLNAEKLLMGTAAIESGFRFFRQTGGGPALGMFQMEPATFVWLYDQFLAGKRHAPLKARVKALSKSATPNAQTMIDDHLFAAGMARIRYFAVSSAIPAGLGPQSSYWWVHYNGRSPHGLKPSDYVSRWNLLCAKLYDGKQDAAPTVNDIGDTNTATGPQPMWV